MDDANEIAGMLRVIDEHRSRGECILDSARMVGDEQDHAIWKQCRRAWAAAALTALEDFDVSVELQSLTAPAESFAPASRRRRGHRRSSHLPPRDPL